MLAVFETQNLNLEWPAADDEKKYGQNWLGTPCTKATTTSTLPTPSPPNQPLADDDEQHFSQEDEEERKTITFYDKNNPTVLFWGKEIAKLDGERPTTSKSPTPSLWNQPLADDDHDKQHFQEGK